MKDQVRYVPWPRRPWREPSPIEKLEIIREQIKINDLAPTDLMWMERDTILRRREAALMVELEKMKDMHSVRSDGAGTP